MDAKTRLAYNQLNYFGGGGNNNDQPPSSSSTTVNKGNIFSPNATTSTPAPFFSPPSTNNHRYSSQRGGPLSPQLYDSPTTGPLSTESALPGQGLYRNLSNSTVSSAKPKLPSYTEIHTSSPQAAGLPILEIIRKLEEESILTRHDRLIVKDAIYSDNIIRRDEVIRALNDIELQGQSKFSIRRLKAILYENGSGEVSSKQMNNNSNETNKANGSNKNNHPTNFNLTAKNMIQQYLQQQQQQPGMNDNIHAKIAQLNNAIPSNNNLLDSPTGSSSSQLTKSLKRIYVSQPIPSDQNNPLQQQQQQSQRNMINHNIKLNSKSADDSSNKSNNNALNTEDLDESPLNTSRSSITKFNSFKKIENNNNNPSQQGKVPRNQSTSSQGVVSNDPSPNFKSPPAPQRYNSMSSSNNQSSDSKPKQQLQSARASSDRMKLQPQSASKDQKHSTFLASPAVPPAQHIPYDEDEEEKDSWNVQDTVNKVVGDSNDYSGMNNNTNILSKVHHRLLDVQRKTNNQLSQLLNGNNGGGGRRLAILVGTGSFNPLTRMHLRTYFLAKQYLESHCGYIILGSLLSPSHAVTVRERYRTNPSEILPSPHRLAIAQLLVQNSQWLSVDPWEMTRRRAMDYLSLLEHVSVMIREAIPDYPIQVIYVCKPNLVPTLSPQALKNANYHCVTVCRTAESDYLRNHLGGKWNGVINVVEDTAILDASLDMVTSRKVREKMKNYESVENLVGAKINEYIMIHRLGAKVRNKRIKKYLNVIDWC